MVAEIRNSEEEDYEEAARRTYWLNGRNYSCEFQEHWRGDGYSWLYPKDEITLYLDTCNLQDEMSFAVYNSLVMDSAQVGQDSYIENLVLPSNWKDTISVDSYNHLKAKLDYNDFGYLIWPSTLVGKLEFY